MPFAVVSPTISPPTKPGPAVAATPSISSSFNDALFKASSINGPKLST